MTRPDSSHHCFIGLAFPGASGTYMAASKSTSFKRPSEVRSKFSGFRSRWATRLERKYLAKIGSKDFQHGSSRKQQRHKDQSLDRTLALKSHLRVL